jgi:arabinogalactan endo-1,4-beta-galactosidase
VRLLTACAAVAVTMPSATAGADEADGDVVLGVDLSYVNEVEDCGGTYRDGTLDDPFAILAARGANLVRARMWNDPEWTDYSTLDDVIRTFERAGEHGMRTLLDFHYSDEWADPSRQSPPAAWAEITDIDELAATLGDYTDATLLALDAAGVLPDIVQIGNEINSGLVNDAMGLDWDHERPLLEAGIAAVRSVEESTGQEIDVVLHVAQPENALDWFEQAEGVGLTDFDVIGLSYYPQWSSFTPAELGSAVQTLARTSGKDVLVVETGYPWTSDDAGDTADNVLDLPLRGYGVSPEGQAQFMADLTTIVVANGGLGTVYWEPAWLSTECRTRWGQGSHWENATLFDFDGTLHAGAEYLGARYDRLAVSGGSPSMAGDALGDAEDPDSDLTEISAVGGGSTAVRATIAGDVRRWPGALILAIDTEAEIGGDGGRRPYDFVDDDQPELLLESSWNDDPGPGYVTTSMSTWQDGEWATTTFTGRVDIDPNPDGGSTVTWVFPDGSINPAAEMTVMTARRGRAGALADVIDPGTPDTAVAMTLQIGTSRRDPQ